MRSDARLPMSSQAIGIGTNGVAVKRRPHNAEVHGSRSSRVPLYHPVLVTVAPDAEFISALLEWAGEN